MSNGGEHESVDELIDTRISVTRDRELAVVAIQGELDVATSPELRRELAKLLAEGVDSIVMDVTEMSFIDSSGLAVLLSAMKRLRDEHDTRLVLRRVQAPVRRVLEITGLTPLFGIET
jgi:anti-sigma B factor antagonist